MFLEHIEADIQAAEKECDDDAESIITNGALSLYIASVIKGCYKRNHQENSLFPIKLTK